MKKRFIIALDSSTPEQQTAIREWLEDNKVGWWHWLTGTWLVSDSKGVFSAREIRDHLGIILPGVHKLVVELSEDGDTWATFGPNSESRNMSRWLKNNWKKN